MENIVSSSPNRKGREAWSHISSYCVGVGIALAETLSAVCGEERLLSCFLSSVFPFIHSRRPAFSQDRDTSDGQQENRKPKGSHCHLCAPSP